ncbi:MAG: DUF1874 domain-containing protein, partial [Firmicutes bacterium]|nr:DUF1874 domain-containing protein [Bacillota bacterium]
EGGEYVIKAKEITIEQAKEILKKEQFTSAVGHDATARLLANILQADISMNRIAIRATHGDKILAFLLKQRLQEGTIIKSVEELEKIGYEFWLFAIQ